MPAGEGMRRPVKVALRRTARLTRTIYRSVMNRVARPHPAPFIFLGNQKSGTTAIAALLADATGVPATLDLEDLKEPISTRLYRGEIPLSEIIARNRFDFSHPIIKEPALTFFHAQLVELYPDARFTLIVRDPRDNIRSILDRVELPGTLEDIPSEIRETIDPAWMGILYSPWLGLEGSTYIEKLAHRWNLACDVHLRNPDSVHLIRYEEFLEKKLEVIEDLAARVGLRLMKDVSDRLDVQFQPKGVHRDEPWAEFFSPGNLTLIESICGERMLKVGYGLSPGHSLSS